MLKGPRNVSCSDIRCDVMTLHILLMPLIIGESATVRWPLHPFRYPPPASGVAAFSHSHLRLPPPPYSLRKPGLGAPESPPASADPPPRPTAAVCAVSTPTPLMGRRAAATGRGACTGVWLGANGALGRPLPVIGGTLSGAPGQAGGTGGRSADRCSSRRPGGWTDTA